MRINIDDTEFNEASVYLYEGVPFTGEMVETNNLGAIISSVWVRDGRPHGTERSWYPDGCLESETTLANGIAVGTFRQSHPNGQLADQREFSDQGKLISVHRWSEGGVAVESRYTGAGGGRWCQTQAYTSQGTESEKMIGRTRPAADGS